MDELPESDRLLDLPHPREATEFIGNPAAEQKLLQAFRSGKMHHAWIIGGPRGVGKATLAYRLARFVLRNPEPTSIAATIDSLGVPPEDPVFRRVESGGHTDLFVARRAYDPKSKNLRRDITADTVRQVSHFFARTSGEGGWRVCIVDAADDMNRSAANALLKVLEEPPGKSLFLLVSHTPQRLLPTIRSRCIRLTLQPLQEAEITGIIDRLRPGEPGGGARLSPELIALAQGSPGQTISLLEGTAWEQFTRLRSLLGGSTANTSDPDLLDFAEKLGARGAEDTYATVSRLLLDWLSLRIRQTTVSGNGSRRDAAALAEASQEIAHSLQRANALNLDRKQTILHTLQLLENTGAQSILRN